MDSRLTTRPAAIGLRLYHHFHAATNWPHFTGFPAHLRVHTMRDALPSPRRLALFLNSTLVELLPQ